MTDDPSHTRLWRMVRAVIIGGVLAFAPLILILYLLQDKIVYHPRPYDAALRAISSRPLTEIEYRTSQGNQTAFYAAPLDGGVPKRLWLMFGGNGALILQYHVLIEQPELTDTGILMIDYPGYGYNQGKPSGATIQESTNAGIAELAARLKLTPNDLLARAGVIGHSLGTGVALEFAQAHPEIQRILLVAPFTSLYDIAFRSVGPIAHLLHHNFDNAAVLKELGERTPRPDVEIFTGARDQIIPVAMSRRLKADNPWITYVEKPDYEHNQIVTEAAHELAAGPLIKMK